MEIPAEDLLASLTAATAEMVAAALRPFRLGELLVAGGGTRNHTLMDELRARLPGVKMRRTDELGVPEAGKEALVFAIIGFLTLNGLPATVPSCTGAVRASVLGSVTPGRAPAAALAATGPARPRLAPTRLVLRSPLPSR
jgi:anhydro-N-acetylmuramic acid kinase